MKRASSSLGWFAAFAFLAVATWALGLASIQYVAGPPLAFASGFPGDPDDWILAGATANLERERGAIVLRPRVAAQSYAKYLVTLPPRLDPGSTGADRDDLLARLAGLVGAEGLHGRLHGGDRLLRIGATVQTISPPSAPLEDPRDDARVMLFLLGDDHDADPVDYRTVLRSGGSTPAREETLLTALPEGIDAFYVVFMNRFSDGAFRLTDVSVRGVSTTPTYLACALVLAAGWTVFAGRTVYVLVLRGGVAAAFALAVPVIAIVVGVALPETVDLEALRGGFASAMAGLGPLESLDFAVLYKVGHFGFFLAAGVLAGALRRRFGVGALAATAALALLAFSTEGLQLHLFDRTERWTDLLIDGAGIVVGMLLGVGIASHRSAPPIQYNREP